MKNLLAVIIVFGGLALWAEFNSGKRDNSGDVISSGTMDIFSIRPGDCLDESTTDVDEVVRSSVTVVPCGEPHSFEVYAQFDMPGGAYPSPEEFEAAISTGCLEPFQGYFGIAFEDSILGFMNYQPTREGWVEANDREITCMAYRTDGAEMIGLARGI